MALLCVNTSIYVSPLAGALDGADLSALAGPALAAMIYAFLARGQRTSSGDAEARDLGGQGRSAARALAAEAVELPVSHAAEKIMPLVWRELQDRPVGVPAVADADLAAWQARHLDAVSVGVTQRALYPVAGT